MVDEDDAPVLDTRTMDQAVGVRVPSRPIRSSAGIGSWRSGSPLSPTSASHSSPSRARNSDDWRNHQSPATRSSREANYENNPARAQAWRAGYVEEMAAARLEEHKKTIWQKSPACREALKTIAAQSREDWPTKIFARMKWSIDRAASVTKNLYDNAMICYFTDQPPMLPAFQSWASHFMETLGNWPLLQVKFIGKNFYLIIISLFQMQHSRERCS